MAQRPRDRDREEQDRRERLAYVGGLTAALVHEVRTPLNAIQLNAQMLVEDIQRLPPDVRAKFERRARRVYTEVQSLTKTLEAFLAFARPPRVDPAPTDLNRFLRELLEFAQPEMDAAGVKIESDLAPDMYPVVLDQSQFTHVVLNLLRNAQEAVEQRQDKEEVEGLIRIATAEDVLAGTVAILLEDNGVGIRPGDEERIFEAFYTTKPKGTGLGLGIVRRIVEDHNGRIELVPTHLPGAAFRITLPRGKFLEFNEDKIAEARQF
jgi:nitrogen fixation/metabolism regulation signal transduction histidine kinase